MGIFGHLPVLSSPTPSPSPSKLSSSWRQSRKEQQQRLRVNVNDDFDESRRRLLSVPSAPTASSSQQQPNSGAAATTKQKQPPSRRRRGKEGGGAAPAARATNKRTSRNSGAGALGVNGIVDDRCSDEMLDPTWSSSYSLSSSFSDVYLNEAEEAEADDIDKGKQLNDDDVNKTPKSLTHQQEKQQAAARDAAAPVTPSTAKESAAVVVMPSQTPAMTPVTPTAPPLLLRRWPFFLQRSNRSLAISTAAAAAAAERPANGGCGVEGGVEGGQHQQQVSSASDNTEWVAAVVLSDDHSLLSDIGFYDPAAAAIHVMPQPPPPGKSTPAAADAAAINSKASPAGGHHHRQQQQVVSVRSVDEFLFGKSTAAPMTTSGDGDDAASLGIGPVLVATATIPIQDDDDWETTISQRSVNSDETANTANGGLDVRRMHRLLVQLPHHQQQQLYRNRSQILARSSSNKIQDHVTSSSARSLKLPAASSPSPSNPWWKRDIELRPAPMPAIPSSADHQQHHHHHPLGVYGWRRPAFLPADNDDGDGDGGGPTASRLSSPSKSHRTTSTTSTPANHGSSLPPLLQPSQGSSRRRLLIKVQADSWKEAVESLRSMSVEEWNDALMASTATATGSRRRRRGVDDTNKSHGRSTQVDRRQQDYVDSVTKETSTILMSMFSAGLDDDDEPSTGPTTTRTDRHAPRQQRRHSQVTKSSAIGGRSSSKAARQKEHELSSTSSSTKGIDSRRRRMGPEAAVNAGTVLDAIDGDSSFLHSTTLLPRIDARRASSRHVVKLRVKKATTSNAHGTSPRASDIAWDATSSPSWVHPSSSSGRVGGVSDAATRLSLPAAPLTAEAIRKRYGPSCQYQSKIMVQI